MRYKAAGTVTLFDEEYYAEIETNDECEVDTLFIEEFFLVDNDRFIKHKVSFDCIHIGNQEYFMVELHKNNQTKAIFELVLDQLQNSLLVIDDNQADYE